MNTLRSSFSIALRALQVNKLRSSLTMLGVIIGVGAVIAMLSIGAGAEAKLDQQIASLGSNVLQVQPGDKKVNGVSQGWGASQTLTRGDAEAIRAEIPGIIAVAPRVRSGGQVIAGHQNWFTRITGTTPDYIQVHDWPLLEGNFFSDYDEARVAKLAVIGTTVRDWLLPDGTRPLGATIRINTIPFTVVGVLAAKGQSPTGADQDDTILIPLSTSLKRTMGRTGLKADMVAYIEVKADSPESVTRAEGLIRSLLRYRHNLGPNTEDDFQVQMMTSKYETQQEASAIMSLLLASVAAVSLLVGGIGIMNIMLVSVTERTREIGVRQAVGAKTRHILLQFLSEAVTVSMAGGVGGVLAGIVTSRAVAHWAGWPVSIQLSTIVLAFGFAAMVGVFFGYYPARKAAFLDPIEAIRHE